MTPNNTEALHHAIATTPSYITPNIYMCLVCNELWSETEVRRDPMSLGTQRLACNNPFCDGTVVLVLSK